MLGTPKGHIAIEQPLFKKIEVEVVGGLAKISQRTDVIEAKVLMEYDLSGTKLKLNDTVLLKADAGLQQWAKMQYRLSDGIAFVLCPENQILGYRTIDGR
jgi:hypothetical protein